MSCLSLDIDIGISNSNEPNQSDRCLEDADSAQLCPDSPSGTENIWKKLSKALTTTAENFFLPAIHAQKMAFVVPIRFRAGPIVWLVGLLTDDRGHLVHEHHSYTRLASRDFISTYLVSSAALFRVVLWIGPYIEVERLPIVFERIVFIPISVEFLPVGPAPVKDAVQRHLPAHG